MNTLGTRDWWSYSLNQKEGKPGVVVQCCNSSLLFKIENKFRISFFASFNSTLKHMKMPDVSNANKANPKRRCGKHLPSDRGAFVAITNFFESERHQATRLVRPKCSQIIYRARLDEIDLASCYLHKPEFTAENNFGKNCWLTEVASTGFYLQLKIYSLKSL